MKRIFVAMLAVMATSAMAQQNPQPYSELGAFGSILRFEPGTAAKKAGNAALNATPTEAAAAVAGGYVAYKSFRFIGNNPMLAGSALTLGYLVTHPESAEAHVTEHPEDTEKMYNWLESQKQANPAKAQWISNMQDRVVAAGMQPRQ